MSEAVTKVQGKTVSPAVVQPEYKPCLLYFPLKYLYAQLRVALKPTYDLIQSRPGKVPDVHRRGIHL